MAKENVTFVKAIVFIATGHFLLLQKTKEKHTKKEKKTGQIIRNISQALAYVLTFSDKLKRKANFVFQNCVQFTFRVPMGSNYHSLNHLSFVCGICLSFHFYDKISMRHINTHTHTCSLNKGYTQSLLLIFFVHLHLLSFARWL